MVSGKDTAARVAQIEQESCQLSGKGRVPSKNLALLWAVGVSLLLMLLPWIWPALGWLAWPQMQVGTLAHELGHGFAACLSGGSFESLRLYADGSGVAVTRSTGGDMQRALIAAGGPFGPPLVALLLFIAARHAVVARWALALVALVLGLALLLWVRNAFGVIWVLLCASVAGVVAWRATVQAAQAFVCFLAVQLCLASLSQVDYLFVRTARTGAGELLSDTGQMAAYLGGPHWFWGTLIAVLSAGVMAAGLWLFLWTMRTPEVCMERGYR